ncbi:uncharacterized protein LOC132274454 isoform X1 [Cornus florida]|uniref:uncharacterized protein LOC132274454 isoform X1 n=1 Tax=Cornus florida TaxID=4283 RepID=UPI0028A1B79F|nr:uncharacterized protein LOC132274454 isoform X1 [Cornus florida]
MATDQKSSGIAAESCSDIDRIKYIKLYRALVKGDVAKVKAFLDENPEAIYAQISPTGETPIHVAVSHGREELAKELLKRGMSRDRGSSTSGPEKPKEMKDDYGDTPLHIAVRGANKSIANAIVHQSPQLLALGDADGQLPLTIAAIFENYEMLSTLKPHNFDIAIAMYRNTVKGHDQKWIIFTEFIKSKNFGLAKQIWLNEEPEEMIFKDDLYIMAEMVSVFSSGNQLTDFERWVYNSKRMGVLYSSLKSKMDAMDVFSDARSPLSNSKRFIKVRRFLKGLMLSVLKAIGVEKILNLRVKKSQAHELLSMMCSPIWTFLPKHVEVYFEAIKKAIKCGNSEFVEEVLKSNPGLIWGNKESGSIFHIAVAFRQEKIWNLICGLNKEHRNKIIGTLVERNNLLHIAACPMVMSKTIGGPDEASEKLQQGEQFRKAFSEAPGAAMKVQRALQWYKEVEGMVPSSYKILANNNGETPPALFSKWHSELVKEGEKWMRDTATSCTIVATLIVTVMFTAALTLPGGNSDNPMNKGKPKSLDSGDPRFLWRNCFMVFLLSDALSLFSSTTAVLMFLSILTSRFEEKDFLEALPKRLIIGLATLFLSIASMMVTFGATLVIILRGRINWAVAPVASLASVPITLFALLQFPLFLDMISSTYGRGIFNRKTKCSFFSSPNDYAPPKMKRFL